jgi:ribosomal protein L19E
MSTPTFGTKMARNPKYGRPSGRKLRKRLARLREEKAMIESNWAIYYESNQSRFDRIRTEVSSTLFDDMNKTETPLARLCKLINMIKL